MVTKRYIKRGGKIFGPYYYESYRDKTGKVRKKYLKDCKPPKTDRKKITALLFIIAIVLAFSFTYLILNKKIIERPFTGIAVLESEKKAYTPGEEIEGEILLNLKEGELIPADVKVAISYSSVEEFVLSDFVDFESVEGDFFAEDSDLAGHGQGYGLPGTKTIYPTINFQLEIYDSESESDNEEDSDSNDIESVAPEEETETEIPEEPEEESEETETEENNEEQPAEDEETETEETPEEPVEDEEPSDDDSEESESPVTGEAVSETSYTVDGEVSNENDFTYNLELGKKARIVSGTITVNDKPIEDSEISLKTKDNKAIVSTNYAIEEKGFGQEYLGEEIALTFKIRVEDLEFKASSGDLEIKLIYHNHEIASYSELVPVSKKIPLIANQTNKTEQNETKIPTITLLKEIPLIRIPFTQNTTLNLEEYFQGADSYKTKIGDITATFEGHILTLTPDPEFKGARKAKILALTDEQSLESNEFLILVSSGAVQIKTSREQIRVGQPVKWKKEVSKENPGEDISIEVPKDAEKLNVKKLDKKGEVIEEETITGNSLFTGNVVIEVDLGKRKPSIIKTSLNKFNTWLANLKAELSKKLGVTGKVVENPVAEQAEEVVDIILESDSAEEVEGYIIEYETEAPTSEEILTKNGKQITITGPDEILYENVIAFTTLNNNVPVSSAKKIKLYWYNYEYDQLSKEEIVQATTTQVSEVPKEEVVEEISIGKKIATQNNKTNSTNTAVTKSSILTESSPSSTESKTIGQDYVKQETVFDFYDLDFDGFIDYIEWVVPHLSNQTYEIIIEITNAEHLDENKTFISNIYQEVSALDGNWSKIIPSTHYVRVTFEKNLTSSNDITLYPRTITGTPKIEIYEINGSELIAEFSSLIDNQYNKVYLTNLQGSQDTFDLLVLNGEIQIDHIIDPVDTTPPDIDFGTETPSDGSSQSNTNIFVDLDSSDASDHYAFADFDSDLFLWLRMDDTNTTNNPTDLSSYSNNGTLVGNALINSSSGYFGNGSYLDGDGDYIEVPGLDNSFNSSFTVLGWIKTGDDTSNPIIISDYYLNSGGIPTKYYGWKLLVSSSKLTATIGDESTEASTSFDATTINDSVWHHFAAVFPSGGGLPTLYVDGSSETPPVGSTFINPHSLRKFRIADQRLFTGSDNQIDAMMDEILVFNRTLTSAEISALYNASANQYENNFTSLSVGSHTFTGYAVDIAGNKNQTEQRTVTIDATLPTVTIISPSNNSNFNTSSVDFNVSLNENTSWCGLSISGAANQTMMINASGTGANYTNSSIADGSYTFIATCNDTANNYNTSDTYKFLVDTVFPNISFTDPTPINNSRQDYNSIYVNISSSDASDHYTFTDFNNDLILWMRMDDVDSSGNPTDLSTHSNNGTIVDNVTISSSGAFGKSAEFDEQGYINVSGLEVNSSEELTLSAWVKHEAFSSVETYYLISLNDDEEDDYNTPAHMNFYLRNATALQQIIYFQTSDSQGNTVCEAIKSGILPIDTWYHVAATINSTDCLIYVNGIKEANNTVSQSSYSFDVTKIGSNGQGNTVSLMDGFIDEVLIFNRSLTAAEILSLYNASANQYEHNFTSLTDGSHTFTGHSCDKAGNCNQTPQQTLAIDATPPAIAFAAGTENNGEISDTGNVYINIALTNADDMNSLVFNLFDSSSTLVNSTKFTAETAMNFTNLAEDTYTYSATVNDTAGNSASTSDRTLKLISSCLDLSTCTQGSSCTINNNCSLHSGLCTNNLCEFSSLTINAIVYTLYDSNKNGRNLSINITTNTTRSRLTFLSNGEINFAGKNATTIGSGSSGGHGGTLNISVPDLFNTTNADLIGIGGYSTASSITGGTGGTLQINFHGLIRNFTLGTSSPNLGGGGSASSLYGTPGRLIYDKDLDTCPRDADVSGDGRIDFLRDVLSILASYNDVTEELDFDENYDINCDGKINVVELARVGFEYETR